MKSRVKKILIGGGISVVVLAGAAVGLYTTVIPKIVANDWVISKVEKLAKDALKADLVIENPKLKTGLNPDIAFTLGKIAIKKDNQEILNLTNLDTEFSLSEIFAKKLIIKRMLADNIYIDTADLIALFPAQKEEKKEQKPAEFDIDIFSALLGVKKCLITYDNPDIGIMFDARDLVLDRTKAKKYLHFNFNFEMKKDNDKISSSSIPVLKKITMVAWWAASFSISSFSGTGVLPAILVRITVWEMPGSVYSRFSALAAPQKELTPGQES